MEYVVEDTPLGTAGAVKMADKLLAGEPFIVISGDALTDIDLTALIEHHKREGTTSRSPCSASPTRSSSA
jgi:mannose-1-phosphate guanylyltransferase/phosphomannomutase